jgi:peptidoglycan hydrolase-like protein with peptidoglycan-binding domain
VSTDTSGAGRTRYRRRRQIRTAVGIGIGTAVVAAAVVAAVGFGGSDAQTPVASNLPPGTATVTRATLTQTERVSGTLGYGEAVTVTARSSTTAGTAAAGSGGTGTGGAADAGTTGAGGTGTLTWLAPVGSTVKRGQPAYKVDDRPVVLLYGATPLYRALTVGVEGADVKQLEQNLKALGYSGFTVDTTYTSSTASAVKAWQKDLGLDETGTVDPSQAVVAPGQLRVTEHKATVGAPASGAVFTYTGTTRVVTVALDVAKQHLVKPGLSATVTLPDGKDVKGTVARVGTVATTSTAGQGAQQSSSTTIEVVVSIADQAALGTLDSAPVDLTLVSSQRKDVLTVPVAALLALAEGGYGVQVIEGTAMRYVAVETGMFANGRVEVSGNGIAEGMTVGVPK